MEPDTETLDICLPYALHVVYGGSEFRPEWRTEAVVGLARGIMEDSAFERMPILADALEEAGCTDETLLRHCRDPIPHDHQCWALGLALNRYVPPEPPPPAPVVEPPRPVAPVAPRGQTDPADDGARYVAYGLFFLVWLIFKASQWGGGSPPPPSYAPSAPATPPTFKTVVMPGPEPHERWAVPPDPTWKDLYEAQKGESAISRYYRPAPAVPAVTFPPPR